jgi:hypothetical protein
MQKHPAQMRLRHIMPVLFVLVVLVTVAASMIKWVPVLVPLTLVASYALALIVATFATCQRKGWSYFGILPFVFATLHLSYGVGFLIGLFRFWNRWTDRAGRAPQL